MKSETQPQVDPAPYKPEDESLDDRFGWRDHDRAKPTCKHSGRYGHYCGEWDGLWICEDCSEFQVACCCFPGVVKKSDPDSDASSPCPSPLPQTHP
jgi:hypothetical protein